LERLEADSREKVSIKLGDSRAVASLG
jgi:hypothetical protein